MMRAAEGAMGLAVSDQKTVKSLCLGLVKVGNDPSKKASGPQRHICR